jgi:uncharacterized protein YbjT (DUF2867 family)
MRMKILVTGGLGNISLPLTQQLVNLGHEVTVITSSPQRVGVIQEIGALPLVGLLDDAAFVVRAFQGMDAAYLMVPPNFRVSDYNAFAQRIGLHYAAGVQSSGISHVINLSSVGAALAGRAPLEHYYNLEQWAQGLSTNILHLRPGGFYTNFYGMLPMIEQQGIIGNNFGPGAVLHLTHPLDIATFAAEALHGLNFTGQQIQYILSDTKTSVEVASIMGQALGIAHLPWITFSDDQLLEALLAQGMSREAAQYYIVDMGKAIREGKLLAHYQQNTYPVYGKRSFADFSKELAEIFKAPAAL